MSARSKLYPVKVEGETRYFTVPGSGDSQPGPESEVEFELFLAEAIEAYAEASGVGQPRIRTFADAGVLTSNRGLVVRIGTAEFQVYVTLVRSR